MLPSHSDISYFLEVATTQNISRAAERLGITQPSLSMALKRLEYALGIEVLIRKKSGVELTKSGRHFAQEAANLIREWESLKASVLGHAHDLAGRFSIGCHVSVASYSLPTILPKLLDKYPQIEIQLKHDLSRKITESVISHHLDFGIVVNPVFHPDLVIHHLCEDKVTLWDNTGQYSNMLIYDPDLLQAQFILQKLEANNIRFKRIVTSSSLELIADLASTGMGTAILPTRIAARNKTILRHCIPNAPSFNDKICFIYRADSQRTAASKVIVQSIKEAIF